ncbi:hypothetical protein [Paraburkholderia sp. Ac-20347]|uniref:hypothetical protein n=1 Tax=Paraburkholderia sp. Ac-20347 TaxID=2703892 RepID=UPI001980A670|nr:hypothetical protein [Paraburkholderia sp. Ac-20347]MBN3809743.1 hypothetical protein [Paraburkholderia sp. Ac-20347]
MSVEAVKRLLKKCFKERGAHVFEGLSGGVSAASSVRLNTAFEMRRAQALATSLHKAAP